MAFLAPDSELEPMMTVPSSSMSTLAPDWSWIERIILPPGPMTAPIFSGSILMRIMRGAYWLSSGLASVIASAILPRMCIRAALACSRACAMTGKVIPVDFKSICRAVMPSLVPATLKSMSPRASSHPRMSVRTENWSGVSPITKPIAMPATGFLMGTPASMSERVLPHTLAIEVLPLELSISETTRRA